MQNILKTLSLLLFLFVAIEKVKCASLAREENDRWIEWKRLHKKSYTDAYEENFRNAIWNYNLKVRHTLWLKRSETFITRTLSDGQ